MTMINKGTGWTCPGCRQEIQGQFALEVDQNALVFPDSSDPEPKGFQMTMILTGVRISHDCIPTTVRGQHIPGNGEDQARRDILADPDRVARARAAAVARGVDPDAPLEENPALPEDLDPTPEELERNRQGHPVQQDLTGSLPRGMKVYGNPRDQDPYGGHTPLRDSIH